MELELQEVYLLVKALEAATIKAVDAPVVMGTMNKLTAEFERLQALQPKEEQPAE
jgi:hypothetical protein